MSKRTLPGDTLTVTAPNGKFAFLVKKTFTMPSSWTAEFVKELIAGKYVVVIKTGNG